MMASNSFEDVVWSNLLFRSASVTIGLFVSWMSGVAWTEHHKPDFSRDRPGRHGSTGFSFCKFFCDATQKFIHWSRSR